MRTAPSTAGDSSASQALGVRTRALLSALFALHLLAIFVAPMNLPPSSELTQSLADFFHLYLETAYLNHGYHFFAPEPGSSFLIRWKAELPDGSERTGTLPDLNEQWPRLRYHRHFMLSSQVRNLPGLPESYMKHLQHRHGAKRVSLEYIEHRPTGAEAVLRGVRLDDPSSYRTVGIATLDEQGRTDVQLLEPPPGESVRGVPPGAPAPFDRSGEPPQ